MPARGKNSEPDGNICCHPRNYPATRVLFIPIMYAPRLRTLILLGISTCFHDIRFVRHRYPGDDLYPRSDWLNVKSAPYNAAGDGVADDTAAIQAALTDAGKRRSATPTVYFPPGTYKIAATLDWQGANTDKDWSHGTAGCALIGCGRKTVIKWAGPSGVAMFWTKGATITRYIGLAWDGNNSASCAYEASSPMVLSTVAVTRMNRSATLPSPAIHSR